jgi:hypothetical protein
MPPKLDIQTVSYIFSLKLSFYVKNKLELAWVSVKLEEGFLDSFLCSSYVQHHCLSTN